MGMKKKLAVAAALAHHPKLLILDEVTAGLDPMVREEILDVFRDFVSDGEHSILISSHIISDLEKICDYITFLHEGTGYPAGYLLHGTVYGGRCRSTHAGGNLRQTRNAVSCGTAL